MEEAIGYINLTIYKDDMVLDSSFDDPSDVNWFLDLFKASFLDAVLNPREEAEVEAEAVS